jgi:hypothetical protein
VVLVEEKVTGGVAVASSDSERNVDLMEHRGGAVVTSHYDVSTLLNLVLAAWQGDLAGMPLSEKEITVVGRYVKQGTSPYGNIYYDEIADLSDEERRLTVRIRPELRTGLEKGNVYLFRGVFQLSLVRNGTYRSILSVNAVAPEEFLAAETEIVRDERMRRLGEALREKAVVGIRDPFPVLRRKIARSEPIRVLLLYGKNAIVNEDAAVGLLRACQMYDNFKIVERRIGLGSAKEIETVLVALAQELGEENSGENFDFVALLRGGGDGLEVFDDPDVCAAAARMPVPFLVAIGHAADRTFIEQVADRVFVTPTEFGLEMEKLVGVAIEEVVGERAKLSLEIAKKHEEEMERRIRLLEETHTATVKRLESEREESLRQISEMKEQFQGTLAAEKESMLKLVEAEKQLAQDLLAQKKKVEEESEKYKIGLIRAKKLLDERRSSAGTKKGALFVVLMFLLGTLIGGGGAYILLRFLSGAPLFGH